MGAVALRLLVAHLALVAGVHASAARSLQVSVQAAPGPRPARTTHHDPKRDGPLASPDLPSNHPSVRKLVPGCEPEQVHLSLWSGSSVLVSWASCDAKLNQTSRVSTQGVKSLVFFGSKPDALTGKAEGLAASYALDYTSLPLGTSYASPVLHHVLLTGLPQGQKVYYKVASSLSSSDLARAPSSGRLFSFTLPKAFTFPLNMAVVGDPGQTSNTSVTLERIIASKPQVVLNVGDFSYADRWAAADGFMVKGQEGITWGPKWDTWSRMWEPLLSSVPLLHTGGNHEMEPTPSGDRNLAYNSRFPTPYFSGHNVSRGPTQVSAARASPGGDPFANLYYSVELPGVLKFISLTSYGVGQTFDHAEAQYRWLEAELHNVDRARTPWVVVTVHAPFYNTFMKHYKENECMRQSYEPLLAKHADLVFHGHTHAYERMLPMVNFQVSECGPQYITVGDGGNAEGLEHEFIDEVKPAWCANPRANIDEIFPRYQPQQCYAFDDAGRYCPEQQPDYSAVRDASFGFGTLELLSATTARWAWLKNQWPTWQTGDSITITRGSNTKC